MEWSRWDDSGVIPRVCTFNLSRRVYLPFCQVSEIGGEEKEEKEVNWGEVPAWLYDEYNIYSKLPINVHSRLHTG